jgi:hypothetical protein
MATCTATKADGSPCRASAMKGREVCKPHSGDPDVGQKTKLTEDVMARVAQFLRNGNSIQTSMRANGLHPDSYYAWCERGEADLAAGKGTIFTEFTENCARARGEGVAALVNVIRSAGLGTLRNEGDKLVGAPGDWKALAWILERTHPEEFAARSEVRTRATLTGHMTRQNAEAAMVADDDVKLDEITDVLMHIGVVETARREGEDA